MSAEPLALPVTRTFVAAPSGADSTRAVPAAGTDGPERGPTDFGALAGREDAGTPTGRWPGRADAPPAGEADRLGEPLGWGEGAAVGAPAGFPGRFADRFPACVSVPPACLPVFPACLLALPACLPLFPACLPVFPACLLGLPAAVDGALLGSGLAGLDGIAADADAAVGDAASMEARTTAPMATTAMTPLANSNQPESTYRPSRPTAARNIPIPPHATTTHVVNRNVGYFHVQQPLNP
jgi:hypothetical protein